MRVGDHHGRTGSLSRAPAQIPGLRKSAWCQVRRRGCHPPADNGFQDSLLWLLGRFSPLPSLPNSRHYSYFSDALNGPQILNELRRVPEFVGSVVDKNEDRIIPSDIVNIAWNISENPFLNTPYLCLLPYELGLNQSSQVGNPEVWNVTPCTKSRQSVVSFKAAILRAQHYPKNVLDVLFTLKR